MELVRNTIILSVEIESIEKERENGDKMNGWMGKLR